MSVRKEMLERELNKLGFHKAGHEGGSAQQQQQPQGGGDHPQASEGEGHSE
jgi:hypothetical protein